MIDDDDNNTDNNNNNDNDHNNNNPTTTSNNDSTNDNDDDDNDADDCEYATNKSKRVMGLANRHPLRQACSEYDRSSGLTSCMCHKSGNILHEHACASVLAHMQLVTSCLSFNPQTEHLHTCSPLTTCRETGNNDIGDDEMTVNLLAMKCLAQ